MLDNGSGVDKHAGDGIFSAAIPPQANGTIVEFYVQATDQAANSRTWPARDGRFGAGHEFALPGRRHVQSERGLVASADPVVRLIMTEAERAELADIGDANGDGIDESESDAQMNGTFIYQRRHELRRPLQRRHPQPGPRHAQRSAQQLSRQHSQRPTVGRRDRVNINSKYTYLQTVGSAIFNLAGVTAPNANAAPGASQRCESGRGRQSHVRQVRASRRSRAASLPTIISPPIPTAICTRHAGCQQRCRPTSLPWHRSQRVSHRIQQAVERVGRRLVRPDPSHRRAQQRADSDLLRGREPGGQRPAVGAISGARCSVEQRRDWPQQRHRRRLRAVSRRRTIRGSSSCRTTSTPFSARATRSPTINRSIMLPANVAGLNRFLNDPDHPGDVPSGVSRSDQFRLQSH